MFVNLSTGSVSFSIQKSAKWGHVNANPRSEVGAWYSGALGSTDSLRALLTAKF
jgi:hypothetical protein